MDRFFSFTDRIIPCLRTSWIGQCLFRRIAFCILPGLLALLGVAGCNSDNSLLPRKKPVTVTLWSYGGEAVQNSLNSLIDQFNDTEGLEKGIVVQGVYFSVPDRLNREIYNSAVAAPGSRHMPDMFCGYPSNILRVSKVRELVDLRQHFNTAEQDEFFPAFLEYGAVGDKWLLMPVTKSTEALYLNNTDWLPFAQATGLSARHLATWEGIVKVAEAWYNWTDAQTPEPDDGRAFASVDYVHHLFLMAAEQLQQPLYVLQNNETVLIFSRDLARRIWDCYYVPHLKGYFKNDFKYTVYNIKQGTTIAGVTTTAFGGISFPAQVIRTGKTPYAIDCLALPYPVFAGGRPCAPLRGGQDICVVKSTPEREQACIAFMKWFNDNERNLKFTVPKGYLPVKTANLTSEKILPLRDSVANPAAVASFKAVWGMLNNYKLFKNKPFIGETAMEAFLITHLPGKVKADLHILDRRIAAGESRSAVVAELIADANFDEWYEDMMRQTRSLLLKTE